MKRTPSLISSAAGTSGMPALSIVITVIKPINILLETVLLSMISPPIAIRISSTSTVLSDHEHECSARKATLLYSLLILGGNLSLHVLQDFKRYIPAHAEHNYADERPCRWKR